MKIMIADECYSNMVLFLFLSQQVAIHLFCLFSFRMNELKKSELNFTIFPTHSTVTQL